MQEKSVIWDKIKHFLGFWLSFGEEYRPAWHAGEWTKLFGNGDAEHRTKREKKRGKLAIYVKKV